MTSTLVLRKSRRERKSRNLKQKSGEWLIVCGGEKTEVNYVKSLLDYVNKYNGTDKINYKIVAFSIDPKNMVEELNRKISKNIESSSFYYSKIFVIFDKDDFDINQIEQAINLCKNNDYVVCYSDECFEVWLYLHFHMLSVQIPRKELFIKLSSIFNLYNIGDYKKNDLQLFEKINQYGSILKAYQRAKKLELPEDDGIVYGPKTTMYRLLDEIDNHQRELELPSIYEIFNKQI